MLTKLEPEDPTDDATPPRVALVLGGGGLIGRAFHAGALAGLEHDLGWGPRSAQLIVGTSAGAMLSTPAAHLIQPLDD